MCQFQFRDVFPMESDAAPVLGPVDLNCLISGFSTAFHQSSWHPGMALGSQRFKRMRRPAKSKSFHAELRVHLPGSCNSDNKPINRLKGRDRALRSEKGVAE